MFTHVEEGWHVTPIEVGQVIIASLHLELLTTEKFRVSGTIFYDACHDCGALDYWVSWDRQAWRMWRVVTILIGLWLKCPQL